MSEPKIYLKDRFLPASEAAINVYDMGVVMGATVTEMTRTFKHRPFKLEEHVARLYRSCKYVSFNPPQSESQMIEETLKLIENNAALLEPEVDLGIVHFVTAGENPIYAGSAAAAGPMTPTVCIHSFPLPLKHWRSLFVDGAHLVTPSTRHIPPECLDPKTKNRSRLHWYLAEQQAKAVDPAAIPFLLDLDGNITETSGSNLVVVKDRTIYSPTSRNILWGVSLETVRELADQLGLSFAEKNMQLYDVVNADEVWLTTTPYCMAPASKINTILIGDDVPGPVFEEVIAAWSELVGMDVVDQIMSDQRA